MNLNLEKDKMQDEAVKAWVDKGYIGTIKLPTGSGKNFIFLKALHLMEKNNRDVHLFLSESTSRKETVLKEIELFDKIFNTNTLFDYNIEFMCYQTAKKIENQTYGLVCCDEIHDQMTPSYCKFFLKNNTYSSIIGLTAGIKDINYSLDEETLKLFIDKKIVLKSPFVTSKLELLNKFCPICYSRENKDFTEIGFSRKLNIYVIKHRLDSVNRNVLPSKNSNFYTTEKERYNSLTYTINNTIESKPAYLDDKKEFEEKKQAKLISFISKRKILLNTLKSKANVVLHLKSFLKDKGKTLIYGEIVDALKDFTLNQVTSSNDDKTNEKIINDFDKGIINLIASSKKIKQGSNLSNLDNVILHSYNSSYSDFDQRIGRLRVDGDKVGNVFVIVTMDTKEVDYFNEMIKNQKHHNYILCENVLECLEYLNKDK